MTSDPDRKRLLSVLRRVERDIDRWDADKGDAMLTPTTIDAVRKAVVPTVRAVCPGCGRTVAINPYGDLRLHRDESGKDCGYSLSDVEAPNPATR